MRIRSLLSDHDVWTPDANAVAALSKQIIDSARADLEASRIEANSENREPLQLTGGAEGVNSDAEDGQQAIEQGPVQVHIIDSARADLEAAERRDKIMALYDDDYKISAIAQRLNLSISEVSTVVQAEEG